MPGTRCTVAVCTNSYTKTKRAGLTIKYHIFPKSQPIRDIWIKKSRRGGKWNPDTSHICSIHFVEDDYEEYDIAKPLMRPMRRKLKKDAVPSLYLTEPPPSDISPIIKRRRRNNRKVSLDEETLKAIESIVLQPTDLNSRNESNDLLQFYEVLEVKDVIGGEFRIISSYENNEVKKDLSMNLQICSEEQVDGNELISR